MILHIDMDAFYASVEQRDRPELRGKPVIVGGNPDKRGVVSAASYEARTFGVHSAMPSAQAVRLCPQGTFLPVRMEHYANVSRHLREIFFRYTPLVEPLSLDEAFLDVRGSIGLFGSAINIGHKIKQEIKDELQLVASVGIAPNKFLAKIASDLEKPAGFVVVDENKIQEFLEPLAVGRLWGVGKVSNQILDRLAIKTVGQLRNLPLPLLVDHFGRSGEHWWQLARGIDDRRVISDHEAKSISHENTFARDVTDPYVLRQCLLELTDQVTRRLRRHQLRGKTIQLKIRFSDFQTLTRRQTLTEPTHSTETTWQAVCNLFEHRLPNPLPPVRLIGMGISGFDTSGQIQKQLFDQQENQRNSKLDEVTDHIRDQFGSKSIHRAMSLKDKEQE